MPSQQAQSTGWGSGNGAVTPRVSIIVPTYNRADMLKLALESALAQDYENLEIIVSDNASTDHTMEVLSEFADRSRIRIHRNEQNIGMVANWRKSLFEYVTGDWFVILSDDDLLTDPTYIRTAADLISGNPTLTIVYAGSRIVDTRRNEITDLHLPFPEIASGMDVFLSRGLVKPQDFTLCNVLFRVKEARSVGAFSNDTNLSCDTELFLKLCVLGDVGTVHRIVSEYTVHSSNLITSVLKDPELLVGNADSFIKPYVFAKESGRFVEDALSEWADRVLTPMLAITLLTCRYYLPKRYEETRQSLVESCGELVTLAESKISLAQRWKHWKRAKRLAIKGYLVGGRTGA